MGRTLLGNVKYNNHLYNVPVKVTGNVTMSGLNFTLPIQLVTDHDGTVPPTSVTLNQGDTVLVCSSQDSLMGTTKGSVYMYVNSNPASVNPSSSSSIGPFAPVYTVEEAAASSNVNVVRTTEHSTSYDKDTLEVVTDSTGAVTSMYFVTAS